MADETKIIDVIGGPYRGRRLTVSSADFDQAINEHWAADPYAPPDPEPHPPLSEEERLAAHEAACAWAQNVWDVSQQIPEPKQEDNRG